ncbi:hypothetical protein D3C75_1075200 [compost metagenome]
MTSLHKLTSSMISCETPGRKASIVSGMTLAVGLLISCSGLFKSVENTGAERCVMIGNAGRESINSSRCSSSMKVILYLLV